MVKVRFKKRSIHGSETIRKVDVTEPNLDLDSSKSSSFVSFNQRSDFSLNYEDEVEYVPQYPMKINYGGQSGENVGNVIENTQIEELKTTPEIRSSESTTNEEK